MFRQDTQKQSKEDTLEVNDQIVQGENRYGAVQGYAIGGHVEEVNDQPDHRARRP